MYKTFFAAFSAALLGVAIGWPSSAQVANLEKIYPTFETLAIAGILAEAKIPHQISQLEDGSSFLAVQMGPGRTVIVAPARCVSSSGTECYSLIYMAFGSKSQLPYVLLAENLAVVNFFNGWLDLAEVHLNPTTDIPVVVTVLNSDFGVPKGNILATLGIQLQSADYFFSELSKIRSQSNTLSSSARMPDDSSFGMSSGIRQSMDAALVSPPAFAVGRSSIPGHSDQPSVHHKYTKSLQENPGFQALMATRDFLTDFGFRVSD